MSTFKEFMYPKKLLTPFTGRLYNTAISFKRCWRRGLFLKMSQIEMLFEVMELSFKNFRWIFLIVMSLRVYVKERIISPIVNHPFWKVLSFHENSQWRRGGRFCESIQEKVLLMKIIKRWLDFLKWFWHDFDMNENSKN